MIKKKILKKETDKKSFFAIEKFPFKSSMILTRKDSRLKKKSFFKKGSVIKKEEFF